MEGACEPEIIPNSRSDDGSPSSGRESVPKPSPKAVSKIVSKAVVDKREMIISEFIRTEETYVRHLKVIEEVIMFNN